MDRLEAMAIFNEVVEGGSFSAAARKLRQPLATVSRKIADLETHLNARLLTRSTRRLELTDAGRAYLTASRQIIELVGDAERSAAGEYDTPRGALMLTAPVAFGRLQVLPIVTDFLARFPEIQITMTLSDRNLHLIDDHIDVAVRVGQLPDSSLVSTRVGEVHRVICGSPGYLAAHGVPRKPEDLSEHVGVIFAALPGGSRWALKAGERALRETAVRNRLTVNTADAAIDAAVSGTGLTQVLSYQAEPAVRAGKLKLLMRSYEPEGIPIHLVHAGQGTLPLKTRRFLDFCVPRLRASLTAIKSAGSAQKARTAS